MVPVIIHHFLRYFDNAALKVLGFIETARLKLMHLDRSSCRISVFCAKERMTCCSEESQRPPANQQWRSGRERGMISVSFAVDDRWRGSGTGAGASTREHLNCNVTKIAADASCICFAREGAFAALVVCAVNYDCNYGSSLLACGRNSGALERCS